MGYQRLVGELKGLGVVVSATTVKQILREPQLGPAGERRGPHLARAALLRPGGERDRVAPNANVPSSIARPK